MSDQQSPVQRLQVAVVEMIKRELKINELESQLKAAQKDLQEYEERIVPELMDEIGFPEVKTKGGATVVVEDAVFASYPSGDSPQSLEKQVRAQQYLRETGNDGMIKREFVVRYGRDSQDWADQFASQLVALGVEEHAQVEQKQTIHNQTLCAFIRQELREGREIPLDAFGAIVKRKAKVKL